MRWLAAFGYRPIDMETLVRARKGQASLPRRPVVITFDNGLQACVDHALPVLRAHGFTVVFYLVAGLMGQTTRWTLPEVGLELSIMSWDTARALAAEGFQCGAQTVTHPRLAGLDPARCRAELADGRQRLEDELEGPVVHLAYPFGSYDHAVQMIAAEAGYVTACSTRAGLSSADDELMALHRATVYGHESVLDFACRLRTGSAVRNRLRKAVGSVAHRFRRRPGSQP
jgi:peptidoglycan/xylan/chitin deacetylase (PgdA/CDA1 family)